MPPITETFTPVTIVTQLTCQSREWLAYGAVVRYSPNPISPKPWKSRQVDLAVHGIDRPTDRPVFAPLWHWECAVAQPLDKYAGSLPFLFEIAPVRSGSAAEGKAASKPHRSAPGTKPQSTTTAPRLLDYRHRKSERERESDEVRLTTKTQCQVRTMFTGLPPSE